MTVFLVLAGLMGASGVVLAALAAHAAPGAGLDGASQMLLVHALAVLAAVALADAGRLWRSGGYLAMAIWVIGAALFAGDIGMRALAGHRLFPMAAPTGGTALIAGWIVLAVAAVAGNRSADRG